MTTLFGIKLFKKHRKHSSENSVSSSSDSDGWESWSETDEWKPGKITWRERTKIGLLAFAFLVWGLAVSVELTTQEDLRIRLDTTPFGLSYAASIATMGIMTGGLFSVFADRFPRCSDLQLGIMMLTASVSFLYVPFCRSLEQLGICLLVSNLAFFAMQAAAHSQVTALWVRGSKSARYALHLGFTLGAVIGPAIAYPFVSGRRVYDVPAEQETAANETGSGHSENADDVTTEAPYFRIVSSPWRNVSTIDYAYMIVFTLGLLASAGFIVSFVLGLLSKSLGRLEKRCQGNGWWAVLSPRQWASGHLLPGIIMTASLILWCLFQRLLAYGTMRYLVDFGMYSGLSQSEALLLNWAVCAVGILSRVLGVLNLRIVPIGIVLIIVNAGQVLLALLLAILADKSVMALWILAPIFGFFREAAIPTIYSWTGHHIPLYGVLIGWSDLVGTLVIVLYTPVLENMYESQGPSSIFYAALAFATIQMALTLAMHAYSGYVRRQRIRAQVANMKEGMEGGYVHFVGPVFESVFKQEGETVALNTQREQEPSTQFSNAGECEWLSTIYCEHLPVAKSAQN